VEDLRRLKAASQRGNFPLTRIYTGTDELVELAGHFEKNLNMAFPAVPHLLLQPDRRARADLDPRQL
jgi:hypothetical protein